MRIIIWQESDKLNFRGLLIESLPELVVGYVGFYKFSAFN